MAAVNEGGHRGCSGDSSDNSNNIGSGSGSSTEDESSEPVRPLLAPLVGEALLKYCCEEAAAECMVPSNR